MKVMGSKKATVTTGGIALVPLIVGIFTVVLQALGTDPAMVAHIQEVLVWGLTIIIGTYNVGQGLADFGKDQSKPIYELASIEFTEGE